MEFGVLGPVEVVGDGHRYALGGPKQRCVMALLIAGAGHQVSVETLIDGVYGEHAPVRAHRSIHTYISNLRSELGDVIERHGDGYVLRATRSQVDALRFEDLIRQAGDEPDPSSSAAILREALGLWRGLPFADVDGHGLLAPDITRLNELRTAALEARVDADLASGLDRELLGELDALATEFPLHERFRAQQMLALYRAGRQAEALRAFERTRLYLVEEMGLDPSPELRFLEEQILNQDANLLLTRRPAVRRAAVLVADVGDSAGLSAMGPRERLAVVSEQAAVIDHAVTSWSGRVFAHTGSAAFAWFDSAGDAARAAIQMQSDPAARLPSLRIAISVGDLEVATPTEIAGPPLSRAAALVSSAHAGQVLLAANAQAAIAESGETDFVVRSLGPHDLPGLAPGELIYQLGSDDGIEQFPPLAIGSRPPSLPAVGTGLRGYELRERIRSTSLGSVHRGYQPSVGREVAIKVIRSEHANDPGFIRRFEIEAQMVSRLEHPRIVPLLDYWREPDSAFLVMRWMRGGSLAERLAGGLLTITEISDIVEVVCEVLEYAHRNGVAHGNVDSWSIVFDAEDKPYLSDFVVAHPFDSAANLISADIRDLAMLIDRCVADTESIDTLLEVATLEPGFASIVDFLESWRDLTNTTPARPAPAFTPARNPYKGLRAFGELDARDFFGRRTETQRLLSCVAENRMVAVVGPSGVGKSSVVRAGLIPQLRAGALAGSEDWLIVDMLPGGHCFEELASALMRVASEMPADLESDLRSGSRGLIRAVKRYLPRQTTLLLLIDQFEEVFTLGEDDDDRDEFLSLVSAAVSDERSPVRIVVTMRADYLEHPLRYGEFGKLISDAIVPLAAPSSSGLREMIEMPAAAVGVPYEPGLVERIAGDVQDQPGALPLLEFTLTELYDSRTSDALTIAEYEESGGVLGALGRRSEMIYSQLDNEAKRAAREIFLRLVKVAEAGRDTRRRIRQTELAHLGIGSGAVDAVLEAFGDERLLTFDRDPITRGPTVEVAHEAILTQWPRLAQWLEAHREDLLLRGRLAVAATEWEASGRSDEYLLTGGRLTQHEEWTASTELSLAAAERDLLDTSRAMDSARRATRRKTRRRVLVGLSAAALIATVFAVTAVVARSETARQALATQANKMAAEAELQIDEDPERAAIIAMEAIRLGREAGLDLSGPAASLRSALLADRVVARYEGSQFSEVMPDGRSFVTGTQGAVKFVEIDSGLTLEELRFDETSWPWAAALNRDGSKLAVVFDRDGRGVLVIWDVADGSVISQIEPPGEASANCLDWSEDRLAYCFFPPRSEQARLAVYDTRLGTQIWVQDAHGPFAVDPMGRWLAVPTAHDDRAGLGLLDIATGDEVDWLPSDLFATGLSFSPDGSRVAIVGQRDSKVSIIDVVSGETSWTANVDRPFTVAWLDGGDEIIVSGNSGVPYVMDARDGSTRVRLLGHQGIFYNPAAVIPGTDEVLTGGDATDTVIRWDLDGRSTGAIPSVESGTDVVRIAAPTTLDGALLVAGEAGTARVISSDHSTLLEVEGVRERFEEMTSGVVGGGRYLTWVNDLGTSVLYDLEQRRTVYEAPPGIQVADVTPDGSQLLLVTYAPGKTPNDPRIVDRDTGEIIAQFEMEGVCAGFFQPDPRVVFLYDCIKGGGFFDTDTTREIENMYYRGTFGGVMPDGKSVYTVGFDGTLRLSDLEALLAGASYEEAEIWAVKAQDTYVTGVSINADGSRIATVAREERAHVFDASTGDLLATFPYDLAPGRLATPRVVLHPTLPILYVTATGGQMLEFTLDVDELIALARSHLSRSLTVTECRTFVERDDCSVLATP